MIPAVKVCVEMVAFSNIINFNQICIQVNSVGGALICFHAGLTNHCLTVFFFKNGYFVSKKWAGFLRFGKNNLSSYFLIIFHMPKFKPRVCNLKVTSMSKLSTYIKIYRRITLTLE